MSAARPDPAGDGLRIEGLTVAYGEGAGAINAVRDVDLEVARGATLGLVGESGSGKSTLALAALRALPPEGRIVAGTVRLGGDDLRALDGRGLRNLWRHRVKFVPQNPLPSMNPSHTIERQLRETIDPDRPRRADRARVLAMLERVGLADPERVAASYPFELSGGMQQRVMIAMALLGEPELLVMDEPTTNLDVTTEAAILDLVRELVREADSAVLYVSHSLGVVAQLCDRVSVLYAGEVVERGPVRALYGAPRHPYTRGLLDSVPRLGARTHEAPLRPIPGRIPAANDLPPGCVFAPRCPLVEEACRAERQALQPAGEDRAVRCRRWEGIARGELDPRQPLQGGADQRAQRRAPGPDEAPALRTRDLAKRFPVRRNALAALAGRPQRHVHALQGVDVAVPRTRTLGLVGESGSGKSTLARVVVGLEPASEGSVELLGVPLARRLERRDQDALRKLQMVFQSADEALNPYRTVGQTLRRPFVRLARLSRDEADRRVARLLESVKLSPDYAARRPDQLSGGEKQRVAVARAFASQPELILLDESVSGLDVSVQAAVLAVLEELQLAHDGAYLFISHDLAVVTHLADTIAVLYLGQLMETGPTELVLAPPYHPYTEALLAAVPRVEPGIGPSRPPLEGETPSPLEAPRGCPFASRCPRKVGEICDTTFPPAQSLGEGHRLHCHIPLDELAADQTPLAEQPS